MSGGESLMRSISNNKCPDCGDEGFYEGPSGGLSQNIECANPECGSRFNIAVWGGQLMMAERISEPSPRKGQTGQ